jgi:hypothetical protein
MKPRVRISPEEIEALAQTVMTLAEWIEIVKTLTYEDWLAVIKRARYLGKPKPITIFDPERPTPPPPIPPREPIQPPEKPPEKPKPPPPKPKEEPKPKPPGPPAQPKVKPELIIPRTKFPKWWNDEGIAKISLTSPGSQFVITARGDYSLYIGTIVLTVDGECDISFTFGSAGSSGDMHFGGTDEPRGIVIAMGNSPAPCGTGSFMVTGTSDDTVSIGGFVAYYMWKKEIVKEGV